jgi:hypothetical protein
LTFASANDQPERLVMSGIKDGKSDDAGFAFTAPPRIREQAMFPRSFIFGDLTRFAELFVFSQQLVVLGPAQDKTSPMQEDLSQPGIACKRGLSFSIPYSLNSGCVMFVHRMYFFLPGDACI